MIDAHNHLHDERLAPWRPEIRADLARLGVECAVVNGTQEKDWPAVAALAAEHAWVLPSYGLHPWHVRGRSADWLGALDRRLREDARAGVGEVGLDRWIEGHDLADQSEVFRAQLALAASLDRTVTIHCLRAWGALWEIIREAPMNPRGFLIHAYGGRAELVRGLLDRGAHFSFNPYFLHDRKSATRDIFKALPADRILAETDAPDMSPPADRQPRLLHSPDGRAVNHPGNIELAYRSLAELRATPLPELTETIASNFRRLFGSPSPEP